MSAGLQIAADLLIVGSLYWLRRNRAGDLRYVRGEYLRKIFNVLCPMQGACVSEARTCLRCQPRRFLRVRVPLTITS